MTSCSLQLRLGAVERGRRDQLVRDHVDERRGRRRRRRTCRASAQTTASRAVVEAGRTAPGDVSSATAVAARPSRRHSRASEMACSLTRRSQARGLFLSATVYRSVRAAGRVSGLTPLRPEESSAASCCRASTRAADSRTRPRNAAIAPRLGQQRAVDADVGAAARGQHDVHARARPSARPPARRPRSRARRRPRSSRSSTTPLKPSSPRSSPSMIAGDCDAMRPGVERGIAGVARPSRAARRRRSPRGTAAGRRRARRARAAIGGRARRRC